MTGEILKPGEVVETDPTGTWPLEGEVPSGCRCRPVEFGLDGVTMGRIVPKTAVIQKRVDLSA